MIATPVLRKEASMAKTRIYRNVKIDWRVFNTESTNSNPAALLARINYECGDTQNSHTNCHHRGDDVRDLRERAVFLGDNKRSKPDCDAGFGTGRRLLAEFSSPGQADCESVSTASRT